MTGIEARDVEPGQVWIFPTPFWKRELNPTIRKMVNNNIETKIRELMGDHPVDKKWQSAEKQLHTLPELGPVADAVLSVANTALGDMCVAHKGMYISGCWANINPPGVGHTPHTHPNNYLACVYYVRAPEGADTINFLDPRPQVGLIRPEIMGHNRINAEACSVRVSEGQLIMFPAWLRHSVNKNVGTEDRISLAFNLMFKGYEPDMTVPMW